jgi:hypothetical protein
MKNLLSSAFLAFSMILLGMSCSQIVRISPQFEGVDERAKKYVDFFYRVGKRKGKVDESIYNITLGFAELEGTVVGTCRTTLFPLGREITIDPTYWKNASSYERLFIIGHEYGHCYLNRLHTEEEFEDGCPKSIMYPSMSHPACYTMHYKDYVDELFD